MTKKEIVFLAVFANLMALLLFLPLLTADAGLTALHLQAYNVDENDTLYLLANQQIRIVSSDGKVNKFRSPLSRPDAIDVDGQFIYIYSGNKYAQINTSGEVIERGGLDEQSETNIRQPVRKGDSVYQYRSVLGFYKITKETNGIIIDRYRMPVSDAVIRAIQMIGIVILFAFCIGFPLYFLSHKRFAKDGTILIQSEHTQHEHKGPVSKDVGVCQGGTVSVKTKTAKSTGKSASALDREGNER